ncbi:hypothetical protein ABZ342_34675 [Amycolatopsis sp. NPDC005961]|uniref:hypothetical protein n=1 Tax=Amycolatopsis sp. NPDC005961 TaxID=3156720 RepID=UPI003403D0A7
MTDSRSYPAMHPPRRIGFAVTCWFLALLGGAGAVLFGSAAAMSTDSCRPDEIVFPCTETGQQVVFWLPPVGWIVSILLAWLTSALLIRRGGPRWPGVFVGVVVYAVAMVAGWFVAVR